MSEKKKTGGAAKAPKVDKKVPKDVGATFLGTKVPESVRQGMPKLHNMGAANALLLLDAAVGFVLTGASAAGEETLDKCQAALALDDDAFRTVFTSAVQTLRAATRLRRKAADLSKDLQKLNYPAYVADAVTDIVTAKRLELEEAVRRSAVAFPSLVNTRWRVDITICSSALARVMKPSVLMEFTLSTGEVKMFEVPQETFERMRFGVAQVLALMTGYENHPMMQLIADLERSKLKQQKSSSSSAGGAKKKT